MYDDLRTIDNNKIRNTDKSNNQRNKNLTTHDDFTTWFATDEPINSKYDLEEDYQVYVVRIFERISTDNNATPPKSTHIALCGSHGLGKSSIINCVVNELDKNKPDKNSFIHCNINCWAVNEENIAEVVLQQVVKEAHKKIDMSAFKKLPTHYSAALGNTNNSLKILNIFLTKTVSAADELKRLNNVLMQCNLKVLITIQDLDRSNNPIPKLNNLAALLNELKPLQSFSFIIAIDNKPELSEIISKVTDYREDLIKIDFKEQLNTYLEICVEESFKEDRERPSYINGEKFKDLKKPLFNNDLNSSIAHINKLIPSHRVLKNVLRRAETIWQPKKLMGEVDLEALVLIIALRETQPVLFERFIEHYKLIPMTTTKDNTEKEILNKITDNNSFFIPIIEKLSKSNCPRPLKQTLNQQGFGVDYFKRILLETVPANEVSDQKIIKMLREANKSKKVDELVENLFEKNGYCDAYLRFVNTFIKEQSVYMKIYETALAHPAYNKELKDPYNWIYQTYIGALTSENLGKLTLLFIENNEKASFQHYYLLEYIFQNGQNPGLEKLLVNDRGSIKVDCSSMINALLSHHESITAQYLVFFLETMPYLLTQETLISMKELLSSVDQAKFDEEVKLESDSLTSLKAVEDHIKSL